MFEISELKAKKLADLQEIAKSIGLTKTSQLKKLDNMSPLLLHGMQLLCLRKIAQN